MTLIKSVSGIRGTIGGQSGSNFTPEDIVKYSSAYGVWLKSKFGKTKVVVGRDARISGELVSNLVTSTLRGLGIDVLDIGLTTTPTVEIAVVNELAQGGIIITASHNPKNWNALKLLNKDGEFISSEDGEMVLEIAEKGQIEYSPVENLGTMSSSDRYLQVHIADILALDLVNSANIKTARLRIVVDGINSSGGIFIPALLDALGVAEIIELNCQPTGHFAHAAEPLPENLSQLSAKVLEEGADLGIVVDPDVDRLAIVCEDGSMFGEEYTLVAVADYVLQHVPGNTVSNLSSSGALQVITEKHKGCNYTSSKVGEVYVVEEMKRVNAVIGGEGNGGIIYPDLHYGRDALVGVALFLSYLTENKISVSNLRKKLPDFYICKDKIILQSLGDVDHVVAFLKTEYSNYRMDARDGLKLWFKRGWVHLRRSNTEPIIRIYAESADEAGSTELSTMIKQKVLSFLGPTQVV